VVPGAPGRTAVEGDQRALINPQYAPLWLAGIDPELVIVIPSGGAFDWHAGTAPIARAVHGGVANVDDVGIGRVYGDTAEVPAAFPDAVVACCASPACAGVVGAVEATVLGIDQCVDPVRLRVRDGQADAARRRRQSMSFQRSPGLAAVRGSVKAAAGPARGRIDVPGWPARLPERGIHDFQTARRRREIDGPGVGVLLQ